jgi:hypothetical protein
VCWMSMRVQEVGWSQEVKREQRLGGKSLWDNLKKGLAHSSTGIAGVEKTGGAEHRHWCRALWAAWQAGSPAREVGLS